MKAPRSRSRASSTTARPLICHAAEAGENDGVKFLKVMQCRGDNFPQSHGLWEAVPLREVLKLAGKIDTASCASTSTAFTTTIPSSFFSHRPVSRKWPTTPRRIAGHGRLPAQRRTDFLAPGRPVRLIVPWGYGFKNIKWLQRIRLNGDHKAIDTYGGEPDAYLKTQVPANRGPSSSKAGARPRRRGVAVVGMPGLRRVEYWLRPDAGTRTANWPRTTRPGRPPSGGPGCHRPAARRLDRALTRRHFAAKLWGFDPKTGRPKDWPLRYTVATWSVTLKGMKPGAYELRVRTVDQNGHAQPQPRPQQATGRNVIPCKIIKVTE